MKRRRLIILFLLFRIFSTALVLIITAYVLRNNGCSHLICQKVSLNLLIFRQLTNFMGIAKNMGKPETGIKLQKLDSNSSEIQKKSKTLISSKSRNNTFMNLSFRARNTGDSYYILTIGFLNNPNFRNFKKIPAAQFKVPGLASLWWPA